MISYHFSEPANVIEKARQEGFGRLSDCELLSLFTTRKNNESAIDIARKVLQENSGLYFLMSTDPKGNERVDGLTSRQLIQLQASRELALRAARYELQRGDAMTSPAKVREYLSLQLSGLQDEAFCVVFLDNRHRVLEFKVMYQGTLDGAAVYPRGVVKAALVCNSPALLLVHNHPSGVAEPSDADIAITHKLTKALELIDSRILDHLIVGQGTITSMAERGLMK